MRLDEADEARRAVRLAPALQVHQQHAGIEVVGARRQIEVVVPHEEKVARRAQHLVAQGKIPQRSDVVAHHDVAVEVENLLHAVGQDLRNEDAQVGRVRNVSVGADMTVALAVEGLEARSDEHTSELQSLMRISYAVFCLKQYE